MKSLRTNKRNLDNNNKIATKKTKINNNNNSSFLPSNR